MKRILIIGVISIFLLGIVGFLTFYYIFYAANGNASDYVLKIYKDTPFEQVCDSIEAHAWVKNKTTFRWTSYALKYDKYVKPGKYRVIEGESNLDLVRRLRQGQPNTVSFTFNNIRTKEQLLEKVGNNFMFPPKDLETLLNDEEFLSRFQLTPETVLSVFLPNTYEFYFQIEAVDFFEKMYRYYQKFWNEKRLSAARKIGFTPLEISIIASIVEEENYKEFEKPIIAGVYINRLNQGMKLQADPTVKYAVNDFTLKRVLDQHLEFDSPYNTYLYTGLPPAPIRIPEASTLDSVLNYTNHKYIYMCAKEDFSMEHNFTASYREHLNNARRYHEALNRNKIK